MHPDLGLLNRLPGSWSGLWLSLREGEPDPKGF
jgi:hypothetical protein